MKNYFKDKKNIIALYIIFIYFLTSFVLVDYIFFPLLEKIFLSIYDFEFTSIKDFVEKTENINTAYRVSALFELFIMSFLAICIVTPVAPELKIDMKRAGENTVEYSKLFLVSFVGYYAINFTGVIVASLFTLLGYDTSSTNQEIIVSLLTSGNLTFFLTFIVACIFAPVIEELVFRKAIFTVIKNNYLALIVSAFLFGIIHALSTEGPIDLKLVVSIPYIASGVGFGFAYIYSKKNIWTTIFIHAFSNTISIILITMFL